jgi:hypothetical protein
VRGHGGTAGRPSTLSRTHRPPCWCVRCWARSLSSRRRPLWPSLQRRGGASAWRLARRSRAQEPRRDAPGRCGAGKAARPQETEGRGVEPAGDLGIAGRARPPQRARQAVQSEVGRGHARGASAVANWEEPYAPREGLIQAAVIDHRKLLGVPDSLVAQHPKCQTPRSTVKIDAEPMSFDPEPRLV